MKLIFAKPLDYDAIFIYYLDLMGGSVSEGSEKRAAVVDPQLVGHWPGFGLFSWPHSNTGAIMTFWVSIINVNLGFLIPQYKVTGICVY